MRQIIVYKTHRGTWVAECPSLPGCVRHAETRDEAIDAIREAVHEYIWELRQHNAPIPEDRFEAAIVYV